MRLYLIRHAKSSWSDPDLTDFLRPLNARGRRDAPRMARRLKEHGARLDCILSSPAERAWRTAENFAPLWGLDIRAESRLYEASAETMLEIILCCHHLSRQLFESSSSHRLLSA